ncbi:hypothetical protein CMO89_00465 [Candidatus Woesearchaeota archaeon]|jgi:hypothetical protein|nr:hypothetical protein [Candidatus Woesearchaeota archaeon]|tara:strand:- start:35542 stop:36219 length:678 start_codon:yes stop_codon:yes gene_type:complete
MPQELTDLVRNLGISEKTFAGVNKVGKRIEITPYDESHADFFTHCYSRDNESHLGYFVTKGWSPSIEEMVDKYGDKYKESAEYLKAREERHQNTLNRNSKDRYFFTILEEGRPIGYASVSEKEEDGQKVGRVSVMIGFQKDCNKERGTLALRKMLEILAQCSDFEVYDGKVEESNNPSLKMMRKVFGSDIEVTKDFENVYQTLDGKPETSVVQRQYFKRPQEFFF